MEEKLTNEVELCAVNKIKGSYSTYFDKNFNVDGSPASTDLEKMFNAPQDNIQDIVAYSKYCYRKHGIIMRVINIIRDFGATELKLGYPTKNDKVRKCIEDYNKRVDMEQLIRDIIFELAITGNVVCYDRDGKRVDIYPIDNIKVVPLVVNNKQVVAYNTQNKDILIDDYGDSINKSIESAYPKEILEGFKQGKRHAILNTDNTYFAKINASQYEPYGISVILPAFEDLSHKSLLKEAEKATANDIINKILHIQVGDKDNKPNKVLLEAYDKMFNGQSGSLRVTTPHYVNINWVEPETDVFGEDKFVEIDTDILNTLGVSLTLIRGEGGGNYAEGMLNFSGLVRTIEGIRRHIPCIIEDLYRKELVRSGFKQEHAPSVAFGDVVIDKTSKTDLLMQLFQTAGLPYQALYEGFDMDWDYIKVMRQDENEKGMDDIFSVHTLPFQGNSNDESVDGTGKSTETDPQKKTEGGRPTKSDSERKTDKTQSNNDAPRTGASNTNRSAKK